MGAKRIPLFRNELSGAIDYGEDAQLFSLEYRPNLDQLMTGGENIEDRITGVPTWIYKYRVEITTDFTGYLWQSYIQANEDTNIRSSATNWDLTDEVMARSLKKWRLFSPTIATGGRSGVLYFQAKSYYSKKHKEYRWAIPPIKLQYNKGDYFSINMVNKAADESAINGSYRAMVEIMDWRQFT